MDKKVKWIIPGFQGIAFGLMDGLVMTVGMIMGVARATGNPKMVVLTGVIGGIADGFANAIGFYASEQAERGQQIQHVKGGKKTMVHTRQEILMVSVLCYLATLVALVIPTLPFLFFPLGEAMIVSFILATIALFVLGHEVGRVSDENPLWTGLKYPLIGLVGAIICILIGDLLHAWIVS